MSEMVNEIGLVLAHLPPYFDIILILPNQRFHEIIPVKIQSIF